MTTALKIRNENAGGCQTWHAVGCQICKLNDLSKSAVIPVHPHVLRGSIFPSLAKCRKVSSGIQNLLALCQLDGCRCNSFLRLKEIFFRNFNHSRKACLPICSRFYYHKKDLLHAWSVNQSVVDPLDDLSSSFAQIGLSFVEMSVEKVFDMFSLKSTLYRMSSDCRKLLDSSQLWEH